MRKIFVEKLAELAARDPEVMLITGDLGFSVFESFQERFPRQFLNAGLCEQHMIGMAAGLAMEGKKVFVYSIIPFLTFRPLEQIRNDLCYQNLPVKLIGVGSGLAYGVLGGTHHATEDVGVISSLPGMMVFSPADPFEVAALVEKSLDFSGPCYIRLNRAGDPVVHTEESIRGLRVSEPLKICELGKDCAILTVGSMSTVGKDVIESLAQQNIRGILYSVHTLKPVQEESVINIIKDVPLVVTIEELVTRNSFGMYLSHMVTQRSIRKKILNFALPDEFTHKVGSQKFLSSHYGLTKDNILKNILRNISAGATSRTR